MARTLLSFQPDNQDERLRQLLEGGQAPLVDETAAAPPAPDDVPQQDQGADTVAAQPQPDPTPVANISQPQTPAAQPEQTQPMSRQDQILQMLMDERQQNARDPQLDARWKQEEIGALDRADALRGADNHYGLGEFARDNGAALLASALDIGFNKGRGLYGITSATAQGVAAQEAARKQQIQQADEYALKLHQQRGGHQADPVSQMLALGRLGVAQENAGTAGRRVQGTEDWRAQQLNADSPYRQTQVTQAGRTREASTRAGLNAAHELVDQTAADAAQVAGARTTANTMSKNATPPAITPDEQARLDLQTQQLEESKRGRAVTEGLRADNERQRQTNDFNNKYGGAIETLNAANNLQNMIGTEGDIAGVGPFVNSRFMPDALKSPEAIKEQQAFAAFQNPGFVARSGKAVTPTEAPRLEAEFGNLKSTNPEVVRTAVKAIAETMRNTIKRGAVGREDIAREVLSSQHLDDVLGPAVTRPVEDAPQSAVNAMPQVRPPRPYAPSQPGALGGQQPVAPAATSRGGGDTVHVRMKTKDGWDEADVESDLIPYLPKGVVVVP